MTQRLLFLPSDPAAPALCLDLDDDGRVRSRATLAPGTTASPAAPPARTVLVVPGGAVRIDRLELKAHSAAQARAAARALLEDRLAHRTTLHVAVAPESGPGASAHTVAAVDPDVLRDWLGRARAFGLVADVAVPEPLLLPAPEDPDAVHVLEAGDRWLVRGAGLAFSAEPVLAARIVGARARVAVEGGLEALASQALEPAIDLLQGEFAPASAGTRPAAARRLAWLAAALLASPLVLAAAEALWLDLAARALASRADATLRDALPAAAGSGADALQARLQAAHEPRAFAAAAGALFAAVAGRPGTHLVELEYQRGDRLRAVLFHPRPDDLDALRAALAADGWRLVEGGGREAPGGIQTGLVLEPEA